MSLNTVYNLIYEYADKKQPMIDPQLAFLVMGMTEENAKETLAKGTFQQKVDMMVIAHVTGEKRYKTETEEDNKLPRITRKIVCEYLGIQKYLSYFGQTALLDRLLDCQKTVYVYLASILNMPEMLSESKLEENTNYMIEAIKQATPRI